jgi:hypothetical protein
MAGGLKIIPDRLPIPYPNFDLFWGLYQKGSEPAHHD